MVSRLENCYALATGCGVPAHNKIEAQQRDQDQAPRLSKMAKTRTRVSNYPGQTRPAFSVGVTSTAVPLPYNLNLICPILDSLKPNSAVVLLVNDTLPIDFSDLYSTHWADRLLLVVDRRELVVPWLRYRQVFASNEDIPQMVSAFLNDLQAAREKKP